MYLYLYLKLNFPFQRQTVTSYVTSYFLIPRHIQRTTYRNILPEEDRRTRILFSAAGERGGGDNNLVRPRHHSCHLIKCILRDRSKLNCIYNSSTSLSIPLSSSPSFYSFIKIQHKVKKKTLRETQTLRAGCSKA